MRGAMIVLGAFVLVLLAAPTFLHGDEWEQVPSDSGHGLVPDASAGNQSAMACGLVGTLVKQTAKMRDQGVSEESQLASVDNPKGKLYQLTNGSMLSADTAATLRAGSIARSPTSMSIAR